jgi:hypothetical protein
VGVVSAGGMASAGAGAAVSGDAAGSGAGFEQAASPAARNAAAVARRSEEELRMVRLGQVRVS